MKKSKRQLALILAASLSPLAYSQTSDKDVSFPAPPDIRFPVICTVSKLASITPIEIADHSSRTLFKIEKENQYLDVKVIGGAEATVISGAEVDINHGAPFEGRYKLLRHDYFAHAEKSASPYGGELSLTRDTGNTFKQGEGALILKASYYSFSSVVAAAGFCNEM
jgi:hypothetical protein